MEVILENIMQFIYPRDICNYYFVNKSNYKTFKRVRELEKNKGRKKLHQFNDIEGVCRAWYPEGKLQFIYTYKMVSNYRVNSGFYEEWYRDGTRAHKIYYVDGNPSQFPIKFGVDTIK